MGEIKVGDMVVIGQGVSWAGERGKVYVHHPEAPRPYAVSISAGVKWYAAHDVEPCLGWVAYTPSRPPRVGDVVRCSNGQIVTLDATNMVNGASWWRTGNYSRWSGCPSPTCTREEPHDVSACTLTWERFQAPKSDQVNFNSRTVVTDAGVHRVRCGCGACCDNCHRSGIELRFGQNRYLCATCAPADPQLAGLTDAGRPGGWAGTVPLLCDTIIPAKAAADKINADPTANYTARVVDGTLILDAKRKGIGPLSEWPAGATHVHPWPDAESLTPAEAMCLRAVGRGTAATADEWGSYELRTSLLERGLMTRLGEAPYTLTGKGEQALFDYHDAQPPSQPAKGPQGATSAEREGVSGRWPGGYLDVCIGAGGSGGPGGGPAIAAALRAPPKPDTATLARALFRHRMQAEIMRRSEEQGWIHNPWRDSERVKRTEAIMWERETAVREQCSQDAAAIVGVWPEVAR